MRLPMKPGHLLLPVFLVGLAACASSPAPAPTTAGVALSAPSVATVTAPTTAAPTAPAAPPEPMSPGIVNIGDIIGPPTFDAKTTMLAQKSGLLRCYNETRSLIPGLHGKVTLSLQINEGGAVTQTDAKPGGTANDPGLLGCIGDLMKTVTFPRPGGTATVTVPLVFRR
jgi:hypothetical protein